VQLARPSQWETQISLVSCCAACIAPREAKFGGPTLVTAAHLVWEKKTRQVAITAAVPRSRYCRRTTLRVNAAAGRLRAPGRAEEATNTGEVSKQQDCVFSVLLASCCRSWSSMARSPAATASWLRPTPSHAWPLTVSCCSCSSCFLREHREQLQHCGRQQVRRPRGDAINLVAECLIPGAQALRRGACRRRI